MITFFSIKFSYPFFISTIIFVLLLIFLFQFSWLSQCCLIILFVPIIFLFQNPDQNIVKMIIEEFSMISNLDKLIFISILLLLILSFLTLSFPIRFYENGKFEKIFTKLKILPRIILGILNIRAFTDIHLKNSISMKVFKFKNGKSNEIMKIYNEDGTPFLKNTWYLPTCYMTIGNKMLDCMIEMKIHGKITGPRKKYFEGFIKYLKNIHNVKDDEKILFKINQCKVPEKYFPNYEKKLNKKMLPIFLIDVKKLKILKFFRKKILLETGRYLRNNFRIAS